MSGSIVFVLVELDNGTQEFFETAYDGFKFAKEEEARRRGSVEYVAVGEFYDQEGSIYMGQELRHLLRSLDNVHGWLKAQREAEAYEDTED
jgi:hypothetical protein